MDGGRRIDRDLPERLGVPIEKGEKAGIGIDRLDLLERSLEPRNGVWDAEGDRRKVLRHHCPLQ